ncbi:MAG: hypothetical protein C0467_07090 [Planctomycetaceae bacterium]|nr:hypothetical protein [Planctomycetaceae bacterium]
MGVSGQAIRAGRAFVELFADDTKLTRTLTAAANRVKQFAGNVTSIGAKMGATGGIIAAPLGKAFTDAMNKGAEIKRLSVISGETTDTISQLAGAFSIAGAGLDEFGGALDGLRSRVIAAADSNSELIDTMTGLNGRFLITKGVDEQFNRIAASFQRMDNAVDQANQAQLLFGASGAKLLPYLRKGAAGLAELKAEANKAGEIMSAEDIERSSQVSKSFSLIVTELKNTIVALGSAMLPTKQGTKEVTEQIREGFAAARSWISENGAMIVGLAKLAAGAVAGGAALLGIGFALTKAAAGIGLVVAGVKLAATGVGLLLSPIGLVTAAIAGLTALFLTQTETGRKMTGDLSAGFTNMGQTFSEAWGGILAAVKAGDMEGAFKILTLGIKTVWAQAMLTLRQGWNDFMNWTITTLRANPWILPLIGGIVGGLTAGPGGAVVGAAAGAGGAVALEAFGDKITDALTADLKGAQDRLQQNQAELRALIAKGRGGPIGGPEIDGAAIDKARFDSYAKKLTEAAKELPFVGSSTKGAFAGPIGQQLGYADQTAKRQLDATKEVAKGVNKVARAEENTLAALEKWHNEFMWK